MSAIGIVHMDLGSKGGGEAVAMNALEALQDDHSLTLLTLTDPDIEALNGYFNTDVDSVRLEVRTAGHLAPTLHREFGVKYYVLQNALLGRYARRHADEFDLLVSTINELGLPAGSIEYVHFPFDWTVGLDNRKDIFHPTVENGSVYERLCTSVARVTAEGIRANTVFANSAWTADCFETAYGVRPEVLHPPVDTSQFAEVPWDERGDGFVTIGRIERSKRIVELIEIIDGVRERGHDVHLHVVGPTYDEAYFDEVDAMASSRPYIAIEGELKRPELVRLIDSHRYGIHGKRHEHFGMAVAEIAAGGAIPFVPSTGGQHAIVRDDDRLLYDSVEDAVEKIDRVLSQPSVQHDLRLSASEIDRRFGRERFQSSIRRAIGVALGQPLRRRSPADEAVAGTPSVDD